MRVTGIQLIFKQSGGLDIFDYKTCVRVRVHVRARVRVHAHNCKVILSVCTRVSEAHRCVLALISSLVLLSTASKVADRLRI